MDPKMNIDWDTTRLPDNVELEDIGLIKLRTYIEGYQRRRDLARYYINRRNQLQLQYDVLATEDRRLANLQQLRWAARETWLRNA